MADIIDQLANENSKLLVGLAGPGTGKTYTFRKIIESDYFRGKKILILSFINKLVDDLKQDFQNYTNVEVSTLHSFASKLAQINGVNKLRLEPKLDEIVFGKHFNYSESFNNLDIPTEEYKFYTARQDFYSGDKEKVYSFNSIIYFILEVFGKDKSLIPHFDLVLIDEFQDFNKLESELIFLLNQNNKVLLVGDDDQSLYSFKNARPQLIRNLYSDNKNISFTLEYCYRCTDVIVSAVNSLIYNASKAGLLDGRIDKKFLYPHADSNHTDKHMLSKEYSRIVYVPRVTGDKLIYELEKRIIKDIANRSKKRILILTPKYLKKSLYESLINKGFNVVDYELFSDEKVKTFSQKELIDIFDSLVSKKTDNLSLRRILSLYMHGNNLKELIINTIKSNKDIWYLLDNDLKTTIENDISIFKKVKKGKDKLNDKQENRFSKIFNTKNVLKKLIEGFKAVKRNAIEVELTTTLSSKGLSAEYVYYIGIDDKFMLNKSSKKIEGQNICEFLVGITRAKNKLTLISLNDRDPRILKFIDSQYIGSED